MYNVYNVQLYIKGQVEFLDTKLSKILWHSPFNDVVKNILYNYFLPTPNM